MWTTQKERLYRAMHQNGTYIHIPSLGHNSNLVTVFGCNPVFVERTIRMLMLLACEFYVSCIQLKPTYRLSIGPEGIDAAKLSQMVGSTQSEVVLQKQFVEIYGLQNPAKDAYANITEMRSIKVFISLY